MNTLVKFIPHIPAQEIIFFRCIITAIFSYAYLKRSGISPWGNQKMALILRGLFGMISLTAFFVTLQNMPLASAVTIQYLSPLFTLFFAGYILKERVRGIHYLFFIISFLGVLLIRGFDARISTFQLILGVGSALFSGLAYTMIRKTRNTEHPVVVVFYFPLIALPFISVWTLFTWVTPTLLDFGILLGIGICTQLAQVNMTKAFQAERVSAVSALQYLGLIYALLIGYFLFDETYTWVSLAGMLLIITGILFNIFLPFLQKKARP